MCRNLMVCGNRKQAEESKELIFSHPQPHSNSNLNKLNEDKEANTLHRHENANDLAIEKTLVEPNASRPFGLRNPSEL